MVKPVVPSSPPLPGRLALVVGGRFLPAVPVHLSGHEACVRLDAAPRTPRAPGPVRLYVDWDAGGTTELSASLTGVDGDGRTTHLDVHGVSGDWRTFLAWLGSTREA